MVNLTAAAPTLDQLYSDAQTYGALQIAMYFRNLSTTTATATSGYMSVQRCLLGGTAGLSYTIPSVSAPTTGFCLTGFEGNFSSVAMMMAALEYSMGTLTVSGNSFADGVAMPTKVVRGASIQTSSLLPMVYITTTLVATTPTLTITYTNQDGTTNRSATIVLPTNSIAGSCFLLNNLQSGDTGIRDITGLSISSGTGGVIKIIGLLPLSMAHVGGGNQSNTLDILETPMPIFKAEAGEICSFFILGTPLAGDGLIMLNWTPEQ